MNQKHPKTQPPGPIGSSQMTMDVIDIGMKSRERTESVRLLNHALANASILLIKTKKCHWDVAGPQFLPLRELFEKQHETLSAFVEELAERVRVLGGLPLATATEFVEQTDLVEAPRHAPTATECVRALLADHEAVARTLRGLVITAEEQSNDAGTANLLTSMLRTHEQMAWSLRSSLQGESLATLGLRVSDKPASA